MAESDLTEKNTSEENAKTNFKGLGRSGTFITSDNIQNDYLSELVGIAGQELYTKMLLSDSQIRKLYHAVSNPIKSANWSVEPASDDAKDLEVAALIEQILFKDLPDGFIAKLDEILTFPWHGHAVFEVIHKNRIDKKFGPYTGLANIAFRDQRTLDKWKFNREGVLEFIHQAQSGDVEADVDMPADTLMIFYNEKKGNDSGYPFCRMLYGNYKRKLLYKQLQAIGIEKGAIGVPKLELPEGIDFDSPEFEAAVEQLELYTQAENAYIILPNGYILTLDHSNTFDPAKVQVAVKAENEEISGSLVAMWLEMGIGGNSAVGSSTGISAEAFKDGIEYLANKIADPFNLDLIPNLVALNFGDTIETLPKLVHNGIADEAGIELMQIVTGYVDKGIIVPDEPLEDHVRKTHNLPKKADGELLDNGAAQDEDSNNSETDNDIDPPDNTPPDDGAPKREIELSTKKKVTNPKALIDQQAPKLTADIRTAINFSSAKYINDVMARYRQLPKAKKQNATSKIKLGGINNLKKDLKKTLSQTATLSIDMARKEVPTKKDIELNDNERDMLRMTAKFGDIKDIKLNEFSKTPAYIQVLVAKQADLLSSAALTEMRERIDFSFSSIETKSADENVIKQAMEEEAKAYSDAGVLKLKGTNAASLMVNEGRDAFFFEPEVLEEIHSFTFVNFAPKSAICRELAGTTFNTNDAESLRYTPPLHHNCKSYLRANLKSSKGADNLEVSTLSPTPTAKKSITL